MTPEQRSQAEALAEAYSERTGDGGISAFIAGFTAAHEMLSAYNVSENLTRVDELLQCKRQLAERDAEIERLKERLKVFETALEQAWIALKEVLTATGMTTKERGYYFKLLDKLREALERGRADAK